MSTQPTIKGWCPGAYKPMMSGDGLILRIRPRLARLTAKQALGMCDLAQQYGSGHIDLTNRANLQIRGIKEADHEALLEALNQLDLLDADPALEGRRNILVTPFYEAGDITERLATALTDALHKLPELPAKFGFAIDTGEAPLLADASADIRIERSELGLILRADGTDLGHETTEATAINDAIKLARWFANTRTLEQRRMAQITQQGVTAPRPPSEQPQPSLTATGALLGAAFGSLNAADLAALITTSQATALRTTPWRMFVLEGADMPTNSPFITEAHDPVLSAHACPGAPYCPSATVTTRPIASVLAKRNRVQVHVSGCSKGCAFSKPCALTYIGHDGYFDLVRDGCAWDAPVSRGQCASDVLRNPSPMRPSDNFLDG
ncbi:cobalamin biosynthesis protein CobG [Lentibacter algarum]|uniref:cobalamin biosynthesis protein CobG n=1 Tax=Lentibacter algarum TaxID=576131 RepID=UPI001C06B8C9|nr:cobalamin biosynthesis protein CobG [Lentibacter algarum]MBU2981656.1 cobalamin biosynthesis protein CobG [Lentibacter algarum]